MGRLRVQLQHLITAGPTHFDINGNNPDNIALVKIMDLSEWIAWSVD